MDTPGRLLRLLTLLSARPWWTGSDLAERLEVTARTLRRDVTRLRALGYPVETVTGPHGGYRLGASGRLPPLLLEDDEAVAVAVALRSVSGAGASGLETSALSALTKLDQVLPVALRERVAALRTVTVGLQRGGVPPVDLDLLVMVAVACRRPERLRFTYTTADGAVTERLVEPYRLVYTERQWYLVAYDPSRSDWRTFRIDRMVEAKATAPFPPHPNPPDAAALVAHGVAFAVYSTHALIRLHVPAERALQEVPPTVGAIERDEGDSTIVRVGGEPAWVAEFVASLPFRAEVLEPPKVRAAVRRLGRRLLKEHA